ncbi:unnamed protein product [Lactuca saligna]|uniref:F-box/LRR-repeat protein 15/At3g58940/PEG3-like LRR domain-containing protein n=1 Tax=Lactuca saligna TaxID=75948 RepID=A0AA35UYM4_LACSI|nr:unnamed protein product [Lactuca saligna]
MQNIQSRLPVKAAAKTSVLSKSWLHAWSTIPTLIFHVPIGNIPIERFDLKKQQRKQLKLVYIDNTLIRYLRDNIPIERFDLKLPVENREHSSLAQKWIRSLATKTCLKELSLNFVVYGGLMKLPDEILCGENLTSIRVSGSRWLRTSDCPPIINCVSLRELYFSGVRISQQILDHILTSCRLLAKIELRNCSSLDLKTIKVKSLPCLNELKITEEGRVRRVEINNVPNLSFFSCNLLDQRTHHVPFNPHSISLGSSVTELSLGGHGLVTDDASLDMIKSGLPFLESLTLNMTFWTLESFHFTCASIRRFSLLDCKNRLIDIQVHALKLLSFHLSGYTMPSLSFPISTTLEEITFLLYPETRFGASFFLKMREALELSLSSKYYVHIKFHRRQFPLEKDLLDDLKTRLQFPPATNVETLSFATSPDDCLGEENSSVFDALFEICHPELVNVKLMLREFLEKKMTRTMANWHRYLHNFQVRKKVQKKRETLLNPRFLDWSGSYAEFKLEWS